MNQETYNGDLIDGLAKLAIQVTLKHSTDDELLGMVCVILAKPGELTGGDLADLALINNEMFKRAKEIFDIRAKEIFDIPGDEA